MKKLLKHFEKTVKFVVQHFFIKSILVIWTKFITNEIQKLLKFLLITNLS